MVSNGLAGRDRLWVFGTLLFTLMAGVSLVFAAAPMASSACFARPTCGTAVASSPRGTFSRPAQGARGPSAPAVAVASAGQPLYLSTCRTRRPIPRMPRCSMRRSGEVRHRSECRAHLLLRSWLYPLHRDFVFSVLLNQPQTRAALNEYNKNYGQKKPSYVLGYLAHHPQERALGFSFWAGDHRSRRRAHGARWLLRTFFVRDKELFFRPESVMQEQLLSALTDIPTVTNDDLYKQVDYQAFAPGRAVGKLHIVPATTPVDALDFSPDEIVILQGSPIPTSHRWLALSPRHFRRRFHVNMRARAWRIPNAGCRDAGKRYAALNGKTVLYEVQEAAMTLRPATAAEIAAWQRKRSAAVVLPAPNYAVSDLRPLDGMRRPDVTIYGAKAANLGEIVSAHLPGVHVPPGFGVPFAAYQAHLRRHGITAELQALLANPRVAQDAGFRKQQLAALQRRRIEEASVDPQLLDAVAAKIDQDLGGASVFVRSSTNAEDLPNFSGAGLYYTAANVKGRAAPGPGHATGLVFLVELPRRRGTPPLSHRRAGRGLRSLIVASLPATAAGVLVTRNLYEPDNDHTYTINAQRGLDCASSMAAPRLNRWSTICAFQRPSWSRNPATPPCWCSAMAAASKRSRCPVARSS